LDFFVCNISNTQQFKSLGLDRFFYDFGRSLLCSPRLHLFDHK